MEPNNICCPRCGGRLELKYEATYEYSYVLDENAPGLHNQEAFLPYLYDRREQKKAEQFIACPRCGIRQPFVFSLAGPQGGQIDARQLRQVLHAFGQVERKEI